jgi:ribonuclease Z
VIEITFIGTGAAVPPADRGNTAFTVRTDKLLFLADAGPTIFNGLQRAGIEPTAVDIMYLSHGHADHILGVPQIALVSKFIPRNPPLKIFSTAAVRSAVTMIQSLTFPESLDTLNNFDWIELIEGQRQTHMLNDHIRFTTQLVLGPPYMPVMGMRLDFLDFGSSIAYSADTAPSESVVELASGADLLIHESSFSATLEPDQDPTFYFHSDGRMAGQIAAQAEVGKLALVHLSRMHTDHRRVLTAEAAEFFHGEIFVPNDGDVLKL